LDGCRADRITCIVSGGIVETLSLGDSDPAVVMQALRSLHLDAGVNLSFMETLRAQFGWPAARTLDASAV
jgi:hypothetical protein